MKFNLLKTVEDYDFRLIEKPLGAYITAFPFQTMGIFLGNVPKACSLGSVPWEHGNVPWVLYIANVYWGISHGDVSWHIVSLFLQKKNRSTKKSNEIRLEMLYPFLN